MVGRSQKRLNAGRQVDRTDHIKHSMDMVEPSDTDLLLRLKNYEDHFVERKTSGDHKDWLKTVVGFANSTPMGYPAVLYIGVKDSGEIEEGLNLDTIQKTLGKKIAGAYPTVYYLPKVLNEKGKQFLAVIVPGSENRPHFAGPSYVRIGSETMVSSEPQFQALIAQRQSKAYELLKWKGQKVTVNTVTYREGRAFAQQKIEVLLEDCNQFYTTYLHSGNRVSIPLVWIELSYDHSGNMLQIEIRIG
jgi:predicted HTH transcriptional regulator